MSIIPVLYRGAFLEILPLVLLDNVILTSVYICSIYSSDVSKSNKRKSQNRISLKQQRFLGIDKIETFLDFYLVYKYVYLEVRR